MYFQDKFKGKKVLVTGHTGFKGSWLTLWLEVLGAKVCGFSKDIPSSPSHFELAKVDQNISDFRGDINDYEQVLSFFQKEQPDLVFHLGANAIVSECVEDPKDAFLTNTIGTVNVLEAIRHVKGIKAAVIVTSDKCYENMEWEYGYRENDRLGGKDPYSASKACAELVFSSYYKTYFSHLPDLKVASARAGNVIGGGDWGKNRIVPDCIRFWTQNKLVPVRNPASTRPWQHVLEPLSGYLALAAELLDPNSTMNGSSFNFGPNSEVNKEVSELIKEMKKYWEGAGMKIDENHELRQKEARLLKLNCDKALSKLLWASTLNFEETVEMTASWYKQWHQNSPVRDLTLKQIVSYQELARKRGLHWAKGH